LKRKTAVLIPVSIVLLFVVAIWLPNTSWVNRPLYAPMSQCINQLRLIDAAKQQWAHDHNKTNGSVSWGDILPYLSRDSKSTNIPVCPKGGTYTLGNIEENPRCSIGGHTLNSN
jgi:hypothetical protein